MKWRQGTSFVNMGFSELSPPLIVFIHVLGMARKLQNDKNNKQEDETLLNHVHSSH
jgi:hypothetical protein